MIKLDYQTTYVLDNHDQEWQFYCERFLGVNWAGDVVGADICSHDFKDG